jgi:hypothetical protein
MVEDGSSLTVCHLSTGLFAHSCVEALNHKVNDDPSYLCATVLYSVIKSND